MHVRGAAEPLGDRREQGSEARDPVNAGLVERVAAAEPGAADEPWGREHVVGALDGRR